MPIIPQSESRARLEVLKKLLEEGTVSTQEELCSALLKKKFSVTQSTVSRDLRRLGAIKVNGPGGSIVYRLPDEQLVLSPSVSSNVRGLLIDIQHNGSMIVMKTPPGSASLIAHHLDSVKPNGILGTIAGDDTIFVAPSSAKHIDQTIRTIVEELN